jgi:hypothetical protein
MTRSRFAGVASSPGWGASGGYLVRKVPVADDRFPAAERLSTWKT